MLKLEKARGKEISIGLRDKTPFMNQSFLYAFAIALGLHIGAILLFSIQPFIIVGQQLLPATSVEVDRGQLMLLNDNNSAYADIDEKLQKNFWAPPVAQLNLPKFPIVLEDRQQAFLQEKVALVNPFLSIEEDFEIPFMNSTKRTPGIYINVSGELSDMKLLNDGTSQIQYDAKRMSSQILTFMVQVDNKTGRIFWRMPTQKSISHELGVVAEQILNSMLFQSNPKDFVSVGTIEIEII